MIKNEEDLVFPRTEGNKLNDNFSRRTPFLSMSLALLNAPLIFWLVGVGLSKGLCVAFGNLCKTGTVLIPIFIVSGICGALVAGLHLRRSWKNRNVRVQRNLITLTILILAIVAIYLSKAEIP